MAEHESTISPVSPIPRRPVAFRSYSCQVIDTCDMARRNSSPAVPIPSPHEFMGALKRSGSLGHRPPLLERAFSFSNPFVKRPARTPSPRNSALPVSPTTVLFDRADELPDLSDGSTSFSDSRPITPPSPITHPADQPVAPHRLPTKEYEAWARTTELRQFKLNAGINRVHRYSVDEVPYPQSYMRTVRQSEHHNFTLLKQLAGGSPTFSDKTFQPKQVLDIGAGVGHWAAFAAETWADCTVTAFDIVNMSYDLAVDPAVMDRIVWIEGNFLEDWEKWELLRDDTFDFVRLAGWELSVPYDKLEALVRQIKRVLAPNGKVEVVCDVPVYAHAESSLSRSQGTRWNKSSGDTCGSYFDSDSEDEATPTKPKTSSRQNSKRSSGSSSRYPKSSRSSSSSSTQYEDDNTLRNSMSATPWDDDADTLCSTASSHKRAVLRAEMRESHDSPAQTMFRRKLAMSHNVEAWFDAMLRERLGFNVNTHTMTELIDVHDIIKQIFVDVFGGGRVVAIPPFEIAVPTKEDVVEPVRPPTPGKISRKNSHEKLRIRRPDLPKRSVSYLSRASDKSRDHALEASMRESLTSSLLRQAHITATQPRRSVDYSDSSPSVKSSKAMKTLGITASKSRPYQPQGFVIMPNTFVPCSPEALEAHACKHIDTIIECRHALKDFARTHGYDEETFDDIMCEYEQFKRPRMNWPLDYPSLKMICEEPVSPTSATDPPSTHSSWWRWSKPTNNSSHPPPSYEDATPIRTIEVFQAIKPGTAVGAGDIYIPTPTADKDLRDVTNTRELTGLA